jgi:hypothetical protein
MRFCFYPEGGLSGSESELGLRFGCNALVAAVEVELPSQLPDSVADVGSEFEFEVVCGRLHTILQLFDLAGGLVVGRRLLAATPPVSVFEPGRFVSPIAFSMVVGSWPWSALNSR